MILTEVFFFLSFCILVLLLILKIYDLSKEFTEDYLKDIPKATIEWIIGLIAYIVSYVCYSSNLSNMTLLSFFNLEVFFFQIISLLWVLEILVGLFKEYKNGRKDREQER